jgi:hypothetical protein
LGDATGGCCSHGVHEGSGGASGAAMHFEQNDLHIESAESGYHWRSTRLKTKA